MYFLAGSSVYERKPWQLGSQLCIRTKKSDRVGLLRRLASLFLFHVLLLLVIFTQSSTGIEAFSLLGSIAFLSLFDSFALAIPFFAARCFLLSRHFVFLFFSAMNEPRWPTTLTNIVESYANVIKLLLATDNGCPGSAGSSSRGKLAANRRQR